jgi:Flp pilus assembly CpaF family ATPase
MITCEDAAELQLQQPHVVRLETRPPNLEGNGASTMRDLVRNCLRMHPERIIIGEVPGPEAFDLLQAMNTGHSVIENLGIRTGLDSIKQIVIVLIQAEHYGTPLGAALGLVAQESRN